jgi:hypothetical protein
MADLPARGRLNNDFTATYTAVRGEQSASTMTTAVGAVVPVIPNAVGVAPWAVAKGVLSQCDQSSILLPRGTGGFLSYVGDMLPSDSG